MKSIKKSFRQFIGTYIFAHVIVLSVYGKHDTITERSSYPSLSSIKKVYEDGILIEIIEENCFIKDQGSKIVFDLKKIAELEKENSTNIEKESTKKSDSILETKSQMDTTLTNLCKETVGQETIKKYYPSKKLRSIYTCKNGELEGDYNAYFESGDIFFEHHYIKGRLTFH